MLSVRSLLLLATVTIPAIVFKEKLALWATKLYSTTTNNEVEKFNSKGIEMVFTPEDLKGYAYKLVDDKPLIYLAVMGRVFDVSKGVQHYGPGGSYSMFAGRDASRAFVSGDFSDQGLTDEISDLEPQNYLGLKDWVDFYAKEYTEVGKVFGRYYDNNGQPTDYWGKCMAWIQSASRKRELADSEKLNYPPCNSEWSSESGSRLWCTKKSGGIERDWVGVPRRFFSAAGKERCACVRNEGPSSSGGEGDEGDLNLPNLKQYSHCNPKSFQCVIPESNS